MYLQQFSNKEVWFDEARTKKQDKRTQTDRQRMKKWKATPTESETGPQSRNTE